MSNDKKVYLSLSLTDLNQVIVSSKLRHWFVQVWFLNSKLILSSMVLLTFPRSFFAGLINEKRSYIGVTANEFKQRYRNHLKSFQHIKYANNTELSKHIWRLKENNRKFNISWSIVIQVAAYKTGSKRWNLCLEEKLLMTKGKHYNLLNRRIELFSRCRHVTKHLIN